MPPRRDNPADTSPMKIRVTANGPYLVSGGVPLTRQLIVSDSDEVATEYRQLEKYSAGGSYALYRCGRSSKNPYCDGTHARVKFNGRETATESYLEKPERFGGPTLELTDYEPLCAAARFCLRAGGIWKLMKRTNDPAVKEIVIQETADCPSGRLVVSDKKTKAVIEPTLAKSIAVLEDPVGSGLGPYWVKGGIPVISSEGKAYTLRNRITLCRCGKSKNMPFCDSSHYVEKHTRGGVSHRRNWK